METVLSIVIPAVQEYIKQHFGSLLLCAFMFIAYDIIGAFFTGVLMLAGIVFLACSNPVVREKLENRRKER